MEEQRKFGNATAIKEPAGNSDFFKAGKLVARYSLRYCSLEKSWIHFVVITALALGIERTRRCLRSQRSIFLNLG
jgi:hypothetical protein